MPDFGNPFSGLTAEKTLTLEELVRAVRFTVAAEYEAVQLYTQLAESTDNELAKRVLMEIADEEIVHAGELLRLLKELYPREEALYAQGAQEVQEQITLLNSPAPTGQVQESAEIAPSLTVGSLIEND
ncbi:MAG: rubrerythrin [Deltaproteobacteria bacterium]|nr:rubrerythrin [Deltaproteobacteria bacterium]TLN04101.1 MAG: rubrerythrin [bacterium]